MVNTIDFKTKTIFKERSNPGVNNFWGIAMDIGYSSVKGFSNNKVYSFPSYARKISPDQMTIGSPNATDIMYKDEETGEVWCVGQFAQSMISTSDTNDSEALLYGRNRYYSDIFKVIARVGLGIGMIENQFGSPSGKTLVLQTGLPPAYKNDEYMIKDSLSGKHDFSIKLGANPWTAFSFELPIENIFVMPQPMGTLLSVATDNNGRPVADAAKLYKSNVLIFDPGFGTLDVFSIKNTAIESTDTFDNLGMKRVLQETSTEIFKKFHQEVRVPAMQKCLETGVVRCLDVKTRKRTNQSFADILDDANKRVCEEALAKIDTIFNYLFDYDYLIVTGGTGAAWNTMIREHYKNMDSLNIVSGSQNDTLPYIFSNVRGYYMLLLRTLRKMSKD